MCPPPKGPQDGCQGCGGDSTNPPKYPNKPFDIPVTVSKDPNELIGTPGYGDVHFIALENKLQYTVYFENDPKFATSPATDVYLTIPIHPNVNPASLRLGTFGFGAYVFQPPPNSSAYSARLDLKDSLGIYLDIIAGIDIAKNQVFWTFKTIDPATGLQPDNPMRGFLAVNDTGASAGSAAGRGEGFVSFTLAPKSGLATGDTATAQASIVFDVNAAIPTNVWLNTIDALPPASSVKRATAAHDTVTLRLSGADDPGGSGIESYAVYYSENGSPFQLYRKDLADTTLLFTGTIGNTYGFFSLATDHVGHIEPLKTSAEQTVKLLPDTGLVLPFTWLLFEGRREHDDVLLHWAVSAERNCKHYVVERSTDSVAFAETGNVSAAGPSTQTLNYDFTDFAAAKISARRLYYRIRQVLNDSSTLYSETISIPLDSQIVIQQPDRISASPNPFTTFIRLEVVNVVSSGREDKVELYGIDGRLRYQRPLLLKGSTTILLDDLPPLESGLYILKVSVNSLLYTVKMERR